MLLKHLSNFWRALNIPLINCEVESILNWSNDCVLADITVNAGVIPAILAPYGATFKKTGAKLYFPVVNQKKMTKLLEQIKLGFKRTIKRNKCRSQMTIQPQNNKLFN